MANNVEIYTHIVNRRRLNIWQWIAILIGAYGITQDENVLGVFKDVNKILIMSVFILSAIISCYISLWLSPKRCIAKGGYDVNLRVAFQYRFLYPFVGALFLFYILMPVVLTILTL